MTKTRTVWVGIIVLLLSGIAAEGQNSKRREIKRIDSYVRSITAYVERPAAKVEIYANISTNNKPYWRKFRSEKALESFREANDVFEIAFAWRKSGKIVAVNFTFTSGSGDWAHYICHRFRPDGTLAKIEADLRTFYGHISVKRDLYYDKRGRRLMKRTRYRDIETDKPKVPSDDFVDDPLTIYKSTRRLPFLL